MTGVNQLFFCGCLDSDPYMSLKHCDQIIYAELIKRGIKTERLDRRVPQIQALRKLSRKVLYPAAVRRGTSRQSDAVLHIGSQCYANLIPFSKIPVSITCHDLAEHYFAQDMTSSQMRRWERRIALLKEADLIFSISQHTKNDLIDLLNIPAEKIVVNPNGADPAFRVLSESEIPAGLQSKLGSGLKVLAVGADLYRKNLPTLIKAVEELVRRGVPVTLIKVGDPIPQSLMPKAQSLNLINFGHISKTELISLYNLCDVLSFPSLYEGFGLPVVEAQRCGLPCVISNASSLPEVGGDGALYHDPMDVKQLSDQLQKVYEDRALRNELRKKGFKNAQRFSWERHVEILMQGFQQVLGGETGVKK